jgi:hypothetical protein
MRLTIMAGALALAALVLAPAVSSAQTPASKPAHQATDNVLPVESGIYGFAGGRSDIATDPEGVVGECVWIYDAQDKGQVTKGDCSERQPGKFRVVLKPGRYVVHGPGGNQKVEIKQGQWVKVTSIVLLPLGP